MNSTEGLRPDDDSDDEGAQLNKSDREQKSPEEILAEMKLIGSYIENGAITFLMKEYTYLAVFITAFALAIFFFAEPEVGLAYTTVAFIIGGLTSILAGYIGMRVAVYSNIRTTRMCAIDIGKGFIVAHRAGQVLGFVLVGMALLVLVILLDVYKAMFIEEGSKELERYRVLFEMLAGYGLGGSTVALFGRVGGGIYTKAADVGSDLAGKNVAGLDEDDPSNPGVIADNVGDNVGDIAGMGSDLFGSLAESTCAALVVSASSQALIFEEGAMYFPLLITAAGIWASFFTTFFATNFVRVTMDNVEHTLKMQLVYSTIIMTCFVIPLAGFGLPEEFTIGVLEVTNFKAVACVLAGLWSGLVIGFVTEWYTSN